MRTVLHMDMSTHQDDEHVAIGVAAVLLGVTVQTVRRYEDRGLITSTRTLGNQRRYRVGDLRAALTRAGAA